MSEFTKEEHEMIENEIQYVSFKRTIGYKGDFMSREISCGINPEVGGDKTMAWIQRKVNWLLTQDMKYMDSPHDPINNYKRSK
jgi:hypothetical protein